MLKISNSISMIYSEIIVKTKRKIDIIDDIIMSYFLYLQLIKNIIKKIKTQKKEIYQNL